MARKYKRLSLEDKKKIEIMLKRNDKIVDIAAAIGVHRDTIYKELKRNGAKEMGMYTAEAEKTVERKNK